MNVNPGFRQCCRSTSFIICNPDLTFHFDADPDPIPHQRLCESATNGLQTFHSSVLSLYASIVSAHGPPSSIFSLATAPEL
jgi:hypothetical protein